MNPEDVPAELVEKAARAQYENRVIELDQDGESDWGVLPEPWREEWREGARAALAAVLPEAAALEAFAQEMGRLPASTWKRARRPSMSGHADAYNAGMQSVVQAIESSLHRLGEAK